MKLLRALQIIDSDGRLHIPVLLVILWMIQLFLSHDPGLTQTLIGLFLLLNLQADRFFKSRDVQKLHAAELERIQKLENELGEIRGVLSIATQRTMF